MKVLALESSAKAVSVAVCENGMVLAQGYQNTGLTHSVTMMPLLENMLEKASIKLEDRDIIAVAAGPGSFTGLRIGVSAAKGLAWALDKPCCGVSTLEAMAENAHWGTAPRAPPTSGPSAPDFFIKASERSDALCSIYSIKR